MNAVTDTAASASAFAFGPYRLFVAERRLERDGELVKLGARAFDLLALLVEKAGEVVGKREIAERVWPGVIVGETSLRFQVVALRKLLETAGDADRAIATISGRGYCFVLPVAAPPLRSQAEGALRTDRRAAMPPRLSNMVGRHSEVDALVDMVKTRRFATIVGPGGIGKTTVALAAAHRLAEFVDGDLAFVDLTSITTAEEVASTLAAVLQLPVTDRDMMAGIARLLRDRRMLLVLDSCEHVIAATAEMAEQIFQTAPDLHIIATSREALRVDGEHVLALPAFACPEPGADVSVEELLEYPAVQMLLLRAAGSGTAFTVAPSDVDAVIEICRRLDGIPLAIELAAGRIPSYGLRGTAALLEDRFRYLQGGRRTAIPRHRTLADTLAWSIELLDERSGTILRRLAVFVGEFGHDAASVVSGDEIDASEALEIIESLVAKSLVATRIIGGRVRFRLLDTMRAYLLERLNASAEIDLVRRRHAELFRDFEVGSVDRKPARDEADQLPNLRAALEWSFGPRGDHSLGIALAGRAAPLLLRLSQLAECRQISRRALDALDASSRDSELEMELQACLGQSTMFTEGNTADAEVAFERALELAVRFGKHERELTLLGALHIFHERTADFGKALDFAERGFVVAERIGDSACITAAHSLLGIAWHLLGRHDHAEGHLRPAMVSQDRPGIDPTGFGFDHYNRACITFARSLWLRGRPEDAVRLARETVDASASLSHPVTHCIALIWAISIAEWSESWDDMGAFIERFVAHAERHSLQPYQAVGRCMRGQLAIRRGDAGWGVQEIGDTLVSLRQARYEMLTTGFLTTMAEGLLAMGDLDRACAVIGDCAAQMETNGDRLHAPEVLRVQSAIVAAMGNAQAGRTLLDRALTAARVQGATSWELKAACDMVEMGRGDPALLLRPIMSRYGAAGGDGTWIRAVRLLDNMEAMCNA